MNFDLEKFAFQWPKRSLRVELKVQNCSIWYADDEVNLTPYDFQDRLEYQLDYDSSLLNDQKRSFDSNTPKTLYNLE